MFLTQRVTEITMKEGRSEMLTKLFGPIYLAFFSLFYVLLNLKLVNVKEYNAYKMN